MTINLAGGPKLCVMDFHPESRAMRLSSLHPGATLEAVQESTGFEVLLAGGDIPTTDAPTAVELQILREEVDPTSMRLREFPQLKQN